MDVREVNKKLLDELEEMGFPLARAMRALHYSGNSGLEDAISWIIDQEDDPETDQMPSVPVKIEIEGSGSSSVSEEVKLKAQKLRYKSRKRNKEEDKKLEHGKEKEKTMTVVSNGISHERNVARDPDDDRFRKIRLSNTAFKERVGIFEQAVKFLELCGFERVEGGKYLFLRRGADPGFQMTGGTL